MLCPRISVYVAHRKPGDAWGDGSRPSVLWRKDAAARCNARVRLPPQLRIVLGPSRIAAGCVVAVGAATGVLVALLPVPWWAFAAALAGIGVWSWDRLRLIAWRRHAGSAVELALTGDRLIVIRTRNGRLRAGFVREATYVSPSLTAIVWQPDGAWRSQSVLILPDMLSAEDFRQLRVMLRYGRSDVVAGAPTSHA